jgi:site-specific recombinase XerD
MRVGDMTLQLWRRTHRETSTGLAPISLRVTINRKRTELATGFVCPATYWQHSFLKLVFPSKKKDQVLPDFSEETVAEINNGLYELQREVGDLYKRLSRPDPRGPLVKVAPADIRLALRGPRLSKEQQAQQEVRERVSKSLTALYEAFIVERTGLIGVEIAVATDLSHKTRYNRLVDYLQAHNLNGIRPETFTLNHADKLLHWLMTERKFKRTSANKIVQGVSQMLGWAVRREYIEKNPIRHYEFRHQATPPIKFLTVGELEAISSAELPTNTLGLVRDCFVFQCWTGLAYADLSALNVRRDAEYHKDKAGNLRRVLRITRAKSTMYKGYECVIPLLPEAERLLAYYEDEMPVLTNQVYNRYLKELGQFCGISAEKMTTHVGRKTAGTLLLNMGVPLPVVSKFLGHANVLITQKLYAELLDTTVIDAFSMLGGYAPVAEETIPLELAA